MQQMSGPGSIGWIECETLFNEVLGREKLMTCLLVVALTRVEHEPFDWNMFRFGKTARVEVGMLVKGIDHVLWQVAADGDNLMELIQVLTSSFLYIRYYFRFTRFTGKQRLPSQHLGQEATDGPYVDGGLVQDLLDE